MNPLLEKAARDAAEELDGCEYCDLCADEIEPIIRKHLAPVDAAMAGVIMAYRRLVNDSKRLGYIPDATGKDLQKAIAALNPKEEA